MDIKFNQESFDISLVDSGDNLVDLDITASTSEDLMQRLFLRFKSYPRDLFWNVDYGIDYLNAVFGINRPKGTVDIIIRNEILKEPLVREIKSFDSEIVNYTYACKFSVIPVDEAVTITYYILTNENGVLLTDSNGNRLTTSI